MRASYSFFFICLLPLMLFFGSCNRKKAKELNKRMSFWRKDKIPYGTWYAYEQLNQIFSDATINVNKTSPTQQNAFHISDDNEITEDNSTPAANQLMIIVAPSIVPDKAEMDALLNNVKEGAHLFIAAAYMGNILCDSMGVSIGTASATLNTDTDSSKSFISIVQPETLDTLRFSYPGYDMNSYFEALDSFHTTILGFNAEGKANFIKINYTSGGCIYMHTVPLAFTNFFLLHQQNKTYYDAAFSNVPTKVTAIQWDEYFRNANRKQNFSAWNVILNNRSLRWALYVVLLAIFLLLFSELKRRQRVVPVMKPLMNSSLDFVKTIGQLYYQKRNHHDLAYKMAIHFKEYVRSNYHLSTGKLDENFTQQLAFKTGVDKEQMAHLLYSVKMAEDHAIISEEDLLAFNNQLERFYKIKH